MKHAKPYVSALSDQKAVIDLMESFIPYFEEEEIKGYVSCENKTDKSIDLIVGSEKFTVLSSIRDWGKVFFEVFIWEFDLSSITRYRQKKIDSLTLIKDGASLCFESTKYSYDNNRDFIQLVDMTQKYEPKNIEPFFDQLEIYITNKNNPKAFV